jgi:hypothetical protein
MKSLHVLARIALIVAMTAGCQTRAAQCPDDPALAAGRAAWTARHLTDYRFVWQQSCFCVPDATQPIIVTVRHGEIVSATNRNDGAITDDIRKNLMTIDALYRHAADAQCTAAEMKVVAGADGVPSSVFIDPNRLAADEEFRVTISEFSAAP